MKTLSGPIKLPLLLAAVGVLAVFTYKALAADDPPSVPTGVGEFELRLGIDKDGCEMKEPLHYKKNRMKNWLRDKEHPTALYKVKFWKNHAPDVDDHTSSHEGELKDIMCNCKDDQKPDQRGTRQPNGTHVTQRIIFANTKQVEDFTKFLQTIATEADKP